MRYTQKTNHQKPDTNKPKGSNPTSSDPAPTTPFRKPKLREKKVKKEKKSGIQEAQFCFECFLKSGLPVESLYDKSLGIIRGVTSTKPTDPEGIQKPMLQNSLIDVINSLKDVKKDSNEIEFFTDNIKSLKSVIEEMSKKIQISQKSSQLKSMKNARRTLQNLVKNLEKSENLLKKKNSGLTSSGVFWSPKKPEEVQNSPDVTSDNYLSPTSSPPQNNQIPNISQMLANLAVVENKACQNYEFCTGMNTRQYSEDPSKDVTEIIFEEDIEKVPEDDQKLDETPIQDVIETLVNSEVTSSESDDLVTSLTLGITPEETKVVIQKSEISEKDPRQTKKQKQKKKKPSNSSALLAILSKSEVNISKEIRVFTENVKILEEALKNMDDTISYIEKALRKNSPHLNLLGKAKQMIKDDMGNFKKSEEFLKNQFSGYKNSKERPLKPFTSFSRSPNFLNCQIYVKNFSEVHVLLESIKFLETAIDNMTETMDRCPESLHYDRIKKAKEMLEQHLKCFQKFKDEVKKDTSKSTSSDETSSEKKASEKKASEKNASEKSQQDKEKEFFFTWIMRFKQALSWMHVSTRYTKSIKTKYVFQMTELLYQNIVEHLETKYGYTDYEHSGVMITRIDEALHKRKLVNEKNEMFEAKCLIFWLSTLIAYRRRIIATVKNWDPENPSLDSVEKMIKTISNITIYYEASEDLNAEREECQRRINKPIQVKEDYQGILSNMLVWLKEWKVDFNELVKVFGCELEPPKKMEIFGPQMSNFLNEPAKIQERMLIIFNVGYERPKPKVVVNTDSTPAVS